MVKCVVYLTVSKRTNTHIALPIPYRNSVEHTAHSATSFLHTPCRVAVTMTRSRDGAIQTSLHRSVKDKPITYKQRSMMTTRAKVHTQIRTQVLHVEDV
jgi:hypothetical protein